MNVYPFIHRRGKKALQFLKLLYGLHTHTHTHVRFTLTGVPLSADEDPGRNMQDFSARFFPTPEPSINPPFFSFFFSPRACRCWSRTVGVLGTVQNGEMCSGQVLLASGGPSCGGLHRGPAPGSGFRMYNGCGRRVSLGALHRNY